MKNHIKVDGKLLQTNKKWSQLRGSQQNWIHEQIKAEHVKYVEQNNRLPMKKKKADVLDAVWERILVREIWIPRYEYERNAGKMIDRLNRKSSLFNIGEKERLQHY
jgi:hypothetical protein